MNANFRPKLWVPGDWNAFFGFGTNILVNLLTLTALLRFVLKMPDDLVFGRILPATGLLDSNAILELVVWFETTYDFPIKQEEINIDNLGSINAMADFLLSRKR